MTTVAVVDIGSNSIRLLIADKTDDGEITELDRQANVTRLGQGVDTTNTLADEAMERTYTVLDDYAERIDQHDCDDEDRGADQRRPRLGQRRRSSPRRSRQRYGLEPHVLKGDEEARLTYLGATSERDPADTTPTLVLDIGGGSTEMIIGAGPEVRFRVSTQAGVVRQTERHLPDDPPTEKQMDALAQATSARSSPTTSRKSSGPRSRKGSPSPAPPPHWRRSPSTSTPTTPTRSTATSCRPTSATGSSAN